MSLILEALRKSEAERRRGLPPDLHAELPPAPGRRPQAGLAWGAAAVAVLLAFAGWFALRESAPSTAAVAPPGSGAVSQATRTRAAPQPLPARTPVGGTTDAAQVQPPAAARLPEAATAETQPAPTGAAGAQAPAATAPGSGASAAPASDTSATDAPAQEADAPAPAAAMPPAPASSPRSGSQAGAGSAAASPASAATAAPETPPDNGRVLSLAELDPGTRNALPPLKLSMHLWNRDPAQRFVILDGRRLGEGDRIGEAVIVRIERDGLLLEWHGRGIRVPVR